MGVTITRFHADAEKSLSAKRPHVRIENCDFTLLGHLHAHIRKAVQTSMSEYYSVCTGHKVIREECELNMSCCTGSTPPPRDLTKHPCCCLFIAFVSSLACRCHYFCCSEMRRCFHTISSCLTLRCNCKNGARIMYFLDRDRRHPDSNI